MNAPKTLLFVLGMHRAGTSLLTRIVSLAGATLPRNLMPPASGNENGYWEPAEAVILNDAFLASLGSRWDSTDELPEGWSENAAAAAFVERAAALLRDEYGDAGLAVFKDPRLCRLFPLWRRAAELAGWRPVVVLTARDPEEVAASLGKRDGFTPSKATILWLKHSLEAERASRGLPRAVVTYEAALADWRGVLDRIASDVGLVWPCRDAGSDEAIAAFVSDSHRHHRAPPRPTRTTAWARRLFHAFVSAGAGDLDHAAFDAAAALLADAEALFLPIVSAAETLRDAATAKADRTARDLILLAGLLAEEQKRAAPPRPEHSPTTIDLEDWRMVVRPSSGPMPLPDEEIGVFLHVFYPDLAEELALDLRAIPGRIRIYVSTTDADKKSAIEAAFLRQGFEAVAVKILPNRGWDIGPFLLGFADEIRRHPVCLKIHAKKSSHEETSFGTGWRRHLIGELLGSPQRASLALDAFRRYPTLGILMAGHWPPIVPFLRAGANRPRMEWLLGRKGIALPPELPIEFPSGSMFWFRSAAIEPLLSLDLRWEDFEETASSSRDGTLGHAIERSILYFSASAGFGWALLPAAGAAAGDGDGT